MTNDILTHQDILRIEREARALRARVLSGLIARAFARLAGRGQPAGRTA